MLAASISILLLICLGIGIPVGFALAIAGSVGLYLIGGMSMVLGFLETTPFSTTNSYELITVPMFILMAEFVLMSGIASQMFRAAAIWTGRLPGGLAIATALAGAGFGAISGSSVAAAATLSSTSIPSMLERGYEPKFACGVVAISGTLAMLIPPSVALVLYGIIADVSVGKLLIAGVVPGILVTLTIALTVLVLVHLDPSRAPRGRVYSMAERIRSLAVVGPFVFLLLAVTGVIYLGIATPTEASGLGALGALLIALRDRKNVTWWKFVEAVKAALRTSCMIVMIIIGAHIFGYFLTITQTTQDLVAMISALEISRWFIFALIMLIYLGLGCFMEQISILILTVPVVLPVVLALGFDPIWFGIMVVVVGEVGMVTPPVGMNAFVIARYTGRPLLEVFHGAFPHVIAHLLLLAALAAFPQITLWLPETMAK